MRPDSSPNCGLHASHARLAIIPLKKTLYKPTLTHFLQGVQLFNGTDGTYTEIGNSVRTRSSPAHYNVWLLESSVGIFDILGSKEPGA